MPLLEIPNFVNHLKRLSGALMDVDSHGGKGSLEEDDGVERIFLPLTDFNTTNTPMKVFPLDGRLSWPKFSYLHPIMNKIRSGSEDAIVSLVPFLYHSLSPLNVVMDRAGLEILDVQQRPVFIVGVEGEMTRLNPIPKSLHVSLSSQQLKNIILLLNDHLSKTSSSKNALLYRLINGWIKTNTRYDIFNTNSFNDNQPSLPRVVIQDPSQNDGS
jgi:hypothetical protein